MSLSAVRNDLLQILFSLLVLVIGAGLEELLPKVFGVGVPILLIAVQILATRFRLPLAVLFAVAAGTMEDALCSLAPMTSVSYFLFVLAFARGLDLPRFASLFTYPCYQLWLGVWTDGLNVFTRILLAFPFGIATAFVMAGVISFAMGRGALDERS